MSDCFIKIPPPNIFPASGNPGIAFPEACLAVNHFLTQHLSDLPEQTLDDVVLNENEQTQS